MSVASIDRDHGLVGEGLQEARPGCRGMAPVRAGRRRLRQSASHRVSGERLTRCESPWWRRSPRSCSQGPRARPGSPRRLHVSTARVAAVSRLGGLGKDWRQASAPSAFRLAIGRQMDQLAVECKDECRTGTAQLQRGRRDRVEHRLHICWRLADHAQDLARRGLLLQRLRSFR